jgi:hypothetical protein
MHGGRPPPCPGGGGGRLAETAPRRVSGTSPTLLGRRRHALALAFSSLAVPCLLGLAFILSLLPADPSTLTEAARGYYLSAVAPTGLFTAAAAWAHLALRDDRRAHPVG